MSSDQDPMLVVEKGIPSLRAISLEQQVCIIGASSAADVFIDNPFVSRMHAQIVVENDQYRVRDLDSRNGTFINGTRISGEGTRLRSGDRIELGEGQVVLKFQTRGTTLSLSTAPQKDAQALVVDEKSREVWVRGKELEAPLSRKEFDVLHFLYDRIGQPAAKTRLLSRVGPSARTATSGTTKSNSRSGVFASESRRTPLSRSTSRRCAGTGTSWL